MSSALGIADAHSDLLLELVDAEDRLGEANPLHSRWLPHLRAGEVAVQVCAIFVEPAGDAAKALRDALRLATAFRAAVVTNAEDVVALTSAVDLDRVGDGRVGLLLALEGADCLGEEPWLIDVFAQLGVRMVGLTWNGANAFAGGCSTTAGLTGPGERLVDRLVALGMVVDLAHASQATFWDVLARLPEHPVLVSHAACRRVYEHPRNLSDDQLRALRERDGVLGLMLHPLVLDPSRPDLDRVVEHLDHAVEVAGIECVGLGGDFLRQIMRAAGLPDGLDEDGLPHDAAIDGLGGPEDYPALVERLRERGYRDADLRALLRENVLRVLTRALD